MEYAVLRMVLSKLRKFFKKSKIVVGIILILGIAGVSAYKMDYIDVPEINSFDFLNTGKGTAAGTGTSSKTSKYEKVKVIKVKDGDTIVVKKGDNKFTVRLIGVDTPESVHRTKSKNTKWGKKASKYTKKKLLNKTVYLEYDKDKLDPYDRTLAYVYTKKNKKYTMFNATLVKKGYARAAYYSPNGKYRKKFENLQKKAKKAKKGFWKVGYSKAFPK